MYISVLIVILILFIGREGASKPEQPPSMEATEGKEANLFCAHTLTTGDYVHWYKQTKDSLEYLIQTLKKTENDGRYTLTMAEDRKNSTLTIRDVGLQDAAVYYCVAAA
uniref:Ig-like domain-containing protein n=1 Tax=Latimeria chalumnae TaxID=7897 RepID=H3B767_LATCH